MKLFILVCDLTKVVITCDLMLAQCTEEEYTKTELGLQSQAFMTLAWMFVWGCDPEGSLRANEIQVVTIFVLQILATFCYFCQIQDFSSEATSTTSISTSSTYTITTSTHSTSSTTRTSSTATVSTTTVTLTTSSTSTTFGELKGDSCAVLDALCRFAGGNRLGHISANSPIPGCL